MRGAIGAFIGSLIAAVFLGFNVMAPLIIMIGAVLGAVAGTVIHLEKDVNELEQENRKWWR